MADPVLYAISYSFTSFQASTPDEPLPATFLDAEFQNIQTSLASARLAIMDIRKSDGTLANGIVTAASLAADLLTGIPIPTAWATATVYTLPATVFEGPKFYNLLVAHTSGTFATDLAAGKWDELADFTPPGTVEASAVEFTPVGTIAATDAQTAIAEVATDAAAALATLSGTVTTLSGTVTTLSGSLGDLALLDTITAALIPDGEITGPKIANDAVALSQIAHATRGSIIFYGASGAPTELATGTAGQVLQAGGAGADPSWLSLGALAALGYTDLVYTGSSSSNTVYPIGSVVLVTMDDPADAVNRNASATVRLNGSDAEAFLVTGGGTALSGTWRARGFVNSGTAKSMLLQRVA